MQASGKKAASKQVRLESYESPAIILSENSAYICNESGWRLATDSTAIILMKLHTVQLPTRTRVYSYHIAIRS